VFFSELATIYPAFCADEPAPLPPLTVQYADYAVWQRSWLSGNVLADQLNYWRRQLADFAPLELPADYARPVSPSYQGGRLRFDVPDRVRKELEVLCEGERVTLFMLLLAAFQTLLFRYSGQEDIAVGAPIANRNRAEIESIIGFFVNTLVMRSDLSGNPTFRELLRRVRQVTLDAYAHQDLPFEKLVEELQPQRDVALNPFFQVIFQLAALPAGQVPESSLSVLEVELQ